jgi:hypothetical protein
MVMVAHHQKTSDIETVIEGGDMAVLGRTALRSSIDNETGADLHPDQHVVQMGSNAPMLIPMQIAGGTPQNFRKPDPKQQVAIESITVPAGSFARATHYRERTASGELVDTWVSKDVPPFGLLKLQAGTAAQGAHLVMELTAHGENAKAVITAPVRPFDRVALIKQLQPLIAAQRTASSHAPGGQSAAPLEHRAAPR